MINYSTTNNQDFSNIYVGIIILVIGIVGFFVNTHNVIAMYCIASFHTAYGYLIGARALCNIVNLSVFVIYAGPNTIFKFEPAGDEMGRILGLISGISYSAIPVIQVAVSYSRMIAIFLPLSYDILCARKWARVVICCGLIYGLLLCIHDLTANCRFIYDPNRFCWEYQNCPRSVLEYKFIYPVLTCAGITLCINITVAGRLVKERMSSGTHSSSHRDVQLFWKAFTQELFFANDLVWQDFLFSLMDTPLWWFVCSSLMWELAHTCDGLVFLIFDVKLRYFMKNVCKRRVSSTLVEHNYIHS